MNNPKISVLMPIYETNEEHLREAIESILNQTYTDFEFLILNDSPYDTRLDDIVASYADKRIKYHKNIENLGISPSRNKLIDLAKGDYLAVMDHDDISLAHRFEKQIAILDESPEIGVVSCWTDMTSGRELRWPQNDLEIKMILMEHCAILHPASMIRKSVLLDNNLNYDEKYSPAEDYNLWCNLIEYTKFFNVQEVLFRYRDHQENTSTKQATKMYHATRVIWDKVRSKHKDLYILYLSLQKTTLQPTTLQYTPNVLEKIDIRLFCFIPFIKVKNKNNILKVYLFGFLPLLRIKIKEKNSDQN